MSIYITFKDVQHWSVDISSLLTGISENICLFTYDFNGPSKHPYGLNGIIKPRIPQTSLLHSVQHFHYKKTYLCLC